MTDLESEEVLIFIIYRRLLHLDSIAKISKYEKIMANEETESYARNDGTLDKKRYMV